MVFQAKFFTRAAKSNFTSILTSFAALTSSQRHPPDAFCVLNISNYFPAIAEAFPHTFLTSRSTTSVHLRSLAHCKDHEVCSF